MPKPLSDKERAEIKQRLITVAEECLNQYGLKKTSVDELVRRVNIPKGTFYLFYKSKELLFFDVFLSFHNNIQDQLKASIEVMEQPDVESVTTLVFDLYKRVENSFMFRFIMDGDMELLFRKLPQEALDAHNKQDDMSVRHLVEMIPGLREEDSEAFSAALRALFSTMLYRREIGEQVFDVALRILIRGVVIQMFEGLQQ